MPFLNYFKAWQKSLMHSFTLLQTSLKFTLHITVCTDALHSAAGFATLKCSGCMMVSTVREPCTHRVPLGFGCKSIRLTVDTRAGQGAEQCRCYMDRGQCNIMDIVHIILKPITKPKQFLDVVVDILQSLEYYNLLIFVFLGCSLQIM